MLILKMIKIHRRMKTKIGKVKCFYKRFPKVEVGLKWYGKCIRGIGEMLALVRTG